ncbi:hypothetical protein [Streptomyces acidiscabies]
MMYVTYTRAGFTEAGRDGDHVVLEADPGRAQFPPDYLTVEVL